MDSFRWETIYLKWWAWNALLIAMKPPIVASTVPKMYHLQSFWLTYITLFGKWVLCLRLAFISHTWNTTFSLYVYHFWLKRFWNILNKETWGSKTVYESLSMHGSNVRRLPQLEPWISPQLHAELVAAVPTDELYKVPKLRYPERSPR